MKQLSRSQSVQPGIFAALWAWARLSYLNVALRHLPLSHPDLPHISDKACKAERVVNAFLAGRQKHPAPVYLSQEVQRARDDLEAAIGVLTAAIVGLVFLIIAICVSYLAFN